MQTKFVVHDEYMTLDEAKRKWTNIDPNYVITNIRTEKHREKFRGKTFIIKFKRRERRKRRR